jgi:hypothetical protein
MPSVRAFTLSRSRLGFFGKSVRRHFFHQRVRAYLAAIFFSAKRSISRQFNRASKFFGIAAGKFNSRSRRSCTTSFEQRPLPAMTPSSSNRLNSSCRLAQCHSNSSLLLSPIWNADVSVARVVIPAVSGGRPIAMPMADCKNNGLAFFISRRR